MSARAASRWRMMRARVVLLTAACTLVAGSVVAADDGDYPLGDPAIPPGEEELIATMLGRSMALHQCTLTSGHVEYTVIKAVYICPRGEVMVELGHPRHATRTSMQTGQFAITVLNGSPPPAFQGAVASLVRSHEEHFEWIWPEEDAAAEDDAALDDAAE